MTGIVFIYIQFKTKIFEKKLDVSQWLAPTPCTWPKMDRLFVCWRRYFLAVFVGTAFCLGFCYMQKNATQSTVMSRVNNKRKHVHQMRVLARVFQHTFAQKLCVFCMCVGRLSLTCTVFTFENEGQLENVYSLHLFMQQRTKLTVVEWYFCKNHIQWNLY